MALPTARGTTDRPLSLATIWRSSRGSVDSPSMDYKSHYEGAMSSDLEAGDGEMCAAARIGGERQQRSLSVAQNRMRVHMRGGD